jgi:hypothetical protein
MTTIASNINAGGTPLILTPGTSSSLRLPTSAANSTVIAMPARRIRLPPFSWNTSRRRWRQPRH